MYVVNIINRRFFEVKLGDLVVNVEPCKLKTIRAFQNLSKDADEDDLISLLCKVLNKNKEKRTVPQQLIEELDFDEMKELLLAYFKWLANEKNTDPN